MLSELAFPHIRCCLSTIPSDLMKSTAVDESLSSMNQQFCSRENQLLQMLQENAKSTQRSIINIDTNKGSTLFKYLRDKYVDDSVKLLRNWEFIVRKMADYRNHRHFTLKCIKVRITPTSCKIKNPLQFKTPRRYQIIHKAERQLLYDRVRNINRVLDMNEHN